jgi:hypothetical protein
MKYLRIGIGTERVTPTTRRFMLDLGIESTKPANERIRGIIVATIALAGMIWALNAQPDVDTHPALTIDAAEVMR